MDTFLVDGQPVKAEDRRHAAKYYAAVLNRDPEWVEHNGATYPVVGFCENTRLGIFEDDECGRDYARDPEGIMWLLHAHHLESRPS